MCSSRGTTPASRPGGRSTCDDGGHEHGREGGDRRPRGAALVHRAGRPDRPHRRAAGPPVLLALRPHRRLGRRHRRLAAARGQAGARCAAGTGAVAGRGRGRVVRPSARRVSAETGARSPRAPLPEPAAVRPRRARLGAHDRGRRPDRARAQGVGREPVPDPVLVDGAHAPLRPAGAGLRGGLQRPRPRLPDLPRLRRPEPRRHRRLRDAASRPRQVRRGRDLRQATDRASRRDGQGGQARQHLDRAAPERLVLRAEGTVRPGDQTLGRRIPFWKELACAGWGVLLHG